MLLRPLSDKSSPAAGHAGNCTFNETNHFITGTFELDCVVRREMGLALGRWRTLTVHLPPPSGLAQHPSLSYVKTPSNFTSHYIKATTFTTKECKVIPGPQPPYCTRALLPCCPRTERRTAADREDLWRGDHQGALRV